MLASGILYRVAQKETRECGQQMQGAVFERESNVRIERRRIPDSNVRNRR